MRNATSFEIILLIATVEKLLQVFAVLWLVLEVRYLSLQFKFRLIFCLSFLVIVIILYVACATIS